MSTNPFIRRANHIKLGAGGGWASDAILTGKLRFGWQAQRLEDINAGHWDVIERELRAVSGSHQGAVTRDLNSLRTIVESTPEDVWLTFHDGRLWWCRVQGGDVCEDDVSKWRAVDRWSDRDLEGKLLLSTQLPGKIAQLGAHRATQCAVHDVSLLERLLRRVPGPISLELARHRAAASDAARRAIEALHWRDYEILVDMVFRAAGWTRESVLGQQEKGYDLMLREAITGDRYVVQVKSQAGLADVIAVAGQFSPEVCRRIFFVVHSPGADLRQMDRETLPAHVDLVDPQRLAELAIQNGMSRWLESKSN